MKRLFRTQTKQSLACFYTWNSLFRHMTRRYFLKTTSAGAVSLAVPKPSLFAADEDKPLRVALIGCGWYGKTDLLHLIQVAPVELCGLCTVASPAPANAVG